MMVTHGNLPMVELVQDHQKDKQKPITHRILLPNVDKYTSPMDPSWVIWKQWEF